MHKKATNSESKPAMAHNSGAMNTDVSRSHDSAEFNFGTAFHEVRLPKLGDKLIIMKSINGAMTGLGEESVKEAEEDDRTEMQVDGSKNGDSTNRKTTAL